MTESESARPPLPTFDEQDALVKVQAAEDAWNTRDQRIGPAPPWTAAGARARDRHTAPMSTDLHVQALWRYPVKSLRGEPLDEAELTSGGVRGDRVVHVRTAKGPLTGRTRHRLLTLQATTSVTGDVLVAGQPWGSPEAAALVAERAGPGAELAAYRGPERFDVTNLLVLTAGELDEFERRHGSPLDLRRLRPNIVLSGIPYGATAAWRGSAAITIGDALIGVHSPRGRCIVTTIDPDTGTQDLDVFRRIRQDFAGEMALNCWVIRPGTIRVGDRAALARTAEQPADLGGWIVGAPYRV